MYLVTSYSLYLVITIALVVWVARTLFRHGRVFTAERYRDKPDLADSLTHLLVVGFYLLNLGFVTLRLKTHITPDDPQSSIELLSVKVGMVLLFLGAMHFLNVGIFAALRRSPEPPPPPLRPLPHGNVPGPASPGPPVEPTSGDAHLL